MELTLFTCINSSTGQVLYSGVADNPQALATSEAFVLEGEHPPPNTYRSGDSWVEIPAQPSKHHIWNWTTKMWTDPRTLMDHKAKKWEEIKGARWKADVGGFTWNGHRFDSSSSSGRRIQAAALEAMIAKNNGTAFSTNWTLSNNSSVTLSADDMLAVACCLRMHQNDNHQKSRSLRAAIDAATTLAEVEAIVW